MLRIHCPICGMRDETEFNYVGDATIVRPPQDETNAEVWYAYVFLRENPRGPHREHWHHVHGCRQIIEVERDTLTHEISACRLAAEAER